MLCDSGCILKFYEKDTLKSNRGQAKIFRTVANAAGLEEVDESDGPPDWGSATGYQPVSENPKGTNNTLKPRTGRNIGNGPEHDNGLLLGLRLGAYDVRSLCHSGLNDYSIFNAKRTFSISCAHRTERSCLHFYAFNVSI